MATSSPPRTSTPLPDAARPEAPLTLTTDAPRALGLADQLSLWSSLGVSLLIPVAAVFVVAPFGLPPLSLAAALTAVVAGSVAGSLVLGLSAVVGARTGEPSMVVLRGLFGRRGSYLPTVLNLVQCVGWASLEVLVIAEAASRLTSSSLRPLWVILAGVVATLMAVRPLGAVRVVRRYAVWLVLASTAYLFVGVLRQGLPHLDHGSWKGFFVAMDVVIALPVSWAPLAADWTRHSRTPRSAFGGAFAGYAVACAVYFALGVLAVGTVVAGNQTDPNAFIGALLAVPAGALALAVLLVDEVDEAFANVYSTAVSIQNVAPRLDRRVLAVVVGVLAVLIALLIDVVSYESFLLLIGSVFVPLFAVVIVDFFLVRRGDWDLGPGARARWLLALPWAAGFVAYQLVNPGTVSWWSSWWLDAASAVGFSAQPWMSASVVSFAVAALLTMVVGAPTLVRAARLRA